MSTVIKLKRSETASSVPTTSDLEIGEVAVNTADQKIYMRTSSGIVTVADSASASASNSFATIAVSGQSNVVADSSTDTLTLVGAGLNSITTNATTDTITIGTPTSIPFTTEDGTSTGLEMSVAAGTLSSSVSGLHIGFTTADGTSKTTMVLS